MLKMKICALYPRVREKFFEIGCHSTQILDVQITMSFIRLLENPCTDESSNLGPTALFGVVDPTGRGTRCMASMSRYPPSGPRWAVSLPAATKYRGSICNREV